MKWLTGVLLLGAALATGCSGSGGTPSGALSTGSSTAASLTASASGTASTTASPSNDPAKAEFIATANAICAAMNTATAKLGRPPDDPQRLATYLEKNATIVDKTLDQLRQLTPPAADAAVVGSIWQQVERFNRLTESAVTALRSDNQERGATLLQQAEESADRANAASNAYGLTSCGT
jgi:hypothetical protein